MLAFFCALAIAFANAGDPPPAGPKDALTAEIERWSAYLKGNTSTDEMWIDVRDSAGPVLERAGKALRDGRTLLALQRLAAARVNLSASAWLEGRPPGERKETSGFEAEWTRMGVILRNDLRARSPAALDGVRPAAVRALGETALPQVRVYYDASLEYGRNTMPDAGLFYLGAAQAQREFVGFCRSLPAPSSGRPPRLRALAPEIDALEHDLLAVYRPPVSIDRHREFIIAAGTLKEARELDESGLRFGALLRYLDAALRFAPLRRSGTPTLDAAALSRRLGDLEARLETGGIDHSIARLFLESARADLATRADPAAPPAGAGPALAPDIVSDVLPRYFKALEPAPRVARRPPPVVTVTLVRWPYT